MWTAPSRVLARQRPPAVLTPNRGKGLWARAERSSVHQPRPRKVAQGGPRLLAKPAFPQQSGILGGRSPAPSRVRRGRWGTEEVSRLGAGGPRGQEVEAEARGGEKGRAGRGRAPPPHPHFLSPTPRQPARATGFPQPDPGRDVEPTQPRGPRGDAPLSYLGPVPLRLGLSAPRLLPGPDPSRPQPICH